MRSFNHMNTLHTASRARQLVGRVVPPWDEVSVGRNGASEDYRLVGTQFRPRLAFSLSREGGCLSGRSNDAAICYLDVNRMRARQHGERIRATGPPRAR